MASTASFPLMQPTWQTKSFLAGTLSATGNGTFRVRPWWNDTHGVALALYCTLMEKKTVQSTHMQPPCGIQVNQVLGKHLVVLVLQSD
jgi:hypothetical protein